MKRQSDVLNGFRYGGHADSNYTTMQMNLSAAQETDLGKSSYFSIKIQQCTKQWKLENLRN